MSFTERGQGTPLVLLHAFPADSRIWEDQVNRLSDRYRVIAPDLRGFGKTASNDSFSLISLSDDIHMFLKELGALPCVLGGLSMGGYIALAFAKRHPTDLKGLILVDTRAEADSTTAKEGRNRMIQIVREGGAPAVAAELLPKMLSEHTVSHRQEVVRKAINIMESQSPAAIEHALEALRDREDHSLNLPSIPVPTLIIVGEDDSITPPSLAESMNREIPRSQLVRIPQAGHLSSMEQPDEVSLAMRRFLDSL